MSKLKTITTEVQLSEAVRALWAADTTLNWRWKEWQPSNERGPDAIGELVLDKRRIKGRRGLGSSIVNQNGSGWIS